MSRLVILGMNWTVFHSEGHNQDHKEQICFLYAGVRIQGLGYINSTLYHGPQASIVVRIFVTFLTVLLAIICLLKYTLS